MNNVRDYREQFLSAKDLNVQNERSGCFLKTTIQKWQYKSGSFTLYFV